MGWRLPGSTPTRKTSGPRAADAKARILSLNAKLEPENDAIIRAMTPKFTATQGQYLAYISSYLTLHGCAPAEAEMQRFFGVTPPSVHSMVLTLERRGFIRRVPGQARSITLAIPAESLPPLERRGRVK